jgi:hypothetical protein
MTTPFSIPFWFIILSKRKQHTETIAKLTQVFYSGSLNEGLQLIFKKNS